MKKTRLWILSVVILTACVLFGIAASAEETPSVAVSVSGEMALSGTTVRLKVSLDRNPGICAMRLRLGYDAAVLTPIDVTYTSLLGESSVQPNLERDPLLLLWAKGTEDYTDTGVIACVTFRVTRGYVGKTTVSVSSDPGDTLDTRFHDYPVVGTDGCVTIAAQKKNDFNGDGVVSNADISVLVRVLAGNTAEYADKNNDYDVDGNGKVNNRDAIALIRMLLEFDPLKESEDIPVKWSSVTESVVRTSSWGPRLYTLANGTLIAGYETSAGIKTKISADNGATWGTESQASFRSDKSCANVNFFEDGGSLYLSYRAIGAQSDGYYTSLQVSVSHDSGVTWAHHSTVYENLEAVGTTKGVWEPYLGLLNGELTCFYANDCTSVTKYQNIESKTYRNGEWTNRKIICSGTLHRSRDGMPVWQQLSTGDYVLVIEATTWNTKGHPFIIQLLWSADGVTWSKPVDIFIPTGSGSKAGAPGVAELPNGQLVVTFQTDEDATVKGDKTSVMKCIVSDGTNVRNLTAANFSAAENIFGTPDGESSLWTGVHYGNGCLYAAAGTKRGASIKILQLGK